MENPSVKYFVLSKIRKTIGFLLFLILIGKLIGNFVIGGKEFFRNEYVVGTVIGLFILWIILQVTYHLIYDKENTIERLKNLLTKKRIIDILIPVIFGILLVGIWYLSQH